MPCSPTTGLPMLGCCGPNLIEGYISVQCYGNLNVWTQFTNGQLVPPYRFFKSIRLSKNSWDGSTEVRAITSDYDMPTSNCDIGTDIGAVFSGFTSDVDTKTPATKFDAVGRNQDEPSATVVSETALHFERSVFGLDGVFLGTSTIDVTLSDGLPSPEELSSQMQAALLLMPIDIYPRGNAQRSSIHAERFKFRDQTTVAECGFAFGIGTGAAARGIIQVVDPFRGGYSFSGFDSVNPPPRTRVRMLAGKTRIFRRSKVCIFPVLNSLVPCQPNQGDAASNFVTGVLIPDAMPQSVYPTGPTGQGGAFIARATAEDPVSNLGGWTIPACCT